MDPDHEHFLKIYWIIWQSRIVKLFSSLFPHIGMLKLDDFSFFQQFRFGFWEFFFSFCLILCHLDIFADTDSGSQNLEDPTDPDPNNCFKCCKFLMELCLAPQDGGGGKSFVFLISFWIFRAYQTSFSCQQLTGNCRYDCLHYKFWEKYYFNQLINITWELFEAPLIVRTYVYNYY